MPIEQQAQQENVRDSIANAMASLEKEGGDQAGAVSPDTPSDSGQPATKPDAAADANSGLASRAKADATNGAAPTVEQPANGAAPQELATGKGLTDTPARQPRGPASWRPEVREKWSAVPAEVQQEVMRREREVSVALQESAQARQFAERFMQTAAPFQHIIALEGGDPIKTFGDYMKTATMLRSGAPQEKANAVAAAIMQYGVDITMLDAALAGAVQGRPMPQGQMQGGQPPADPRVDQILAFLSSSHQQTQERVEQDAMAELEAFASTPEAEFLDDLRLDIADIMRMAASRGQKVTLKDAYEKAAMLHPEISKIMTQRKAAAHAREAKAALDAKRRAAGSITDSTPRQTGGGANEAPSSVRESIEAAVAQLQG